MLKQEVREQMTADVMQDIKEQAEAEMALHLQGMDKWQMVFAMPMLLRSVLEGITGMSGPEIMNKFGPESLEMSADGNYKYNTVAHALYRMMEDSLVVAASAALNTAQAMLFDKG